MRSLKKRIERIENMLGRNKIRISELNLDNFRNLSEEEAYQEMKKILSLTEQEKEYLKNLSVSKLVDVYKEIIRNG